MGGHSRWKHPEYDAKLRELWPSDLKLHEMSRQLGGVSIAYISQRAKKIGLPSRASRGIPSHPNHASAIRNCVHSLMVLSKHPSVVRAAAKRKMEPWQMLVRAAALVAGEDLFDAVFDDDPAAAASGSTPHEKSL
jgi:hypothetical protein